MTALHMISLTVRLSALNRLTHVYGFDGDEGRMLHHALSECFGKGVIQPFRLLPGRMGSSHGTLYGYSEIAQADLTQTARACATPDGLQVFDLSSLASKPMPEVWRTDQHLAFDVRCVPVRRLLKPLPIWPAGDPDAPPIAYRKGAEVDVYLVDAMRRYPNGLPDDIDRLRLREALYLEWLARQMPAVELVRPGTRVVGLTRARLVRERTALTVPDVTIHGEFTIRDPEGFAHLLARGIGRHGAYGFGMLLLRPARG